jgi:hypothetical protein
MILRRASNCQILSFLVILALSSVSRAERPSPLPGFHARSDFPEQDRWTRLDSGIRIFTNALLALTKSDRLLVIYATPNGNTIEQTLGCAMAEGRDWHFDIQHVAAQIRRLREISPDEDIVLTVVQAPKLSWPAFRQAEKNAGEIIKSLVEGLAKELDANRVVLSGHSGGGSFIFSYINAIEAIPAPIERIAFLDANYAYSDDDRHGDKLLAWLRTGAQRRLIVIAYDDREITLDGKKVVGPTGGTFRASQRMIDRFAKDVSVSDAKHGPFIHRRGLNDQLQFFIHPNPDNKILHTALVGEINGLLHALTLGTPLESTWGTFGGPRAYTKWVQRDPFQETKSVAELSPTLNLPPRPADAPTGSQFLRQIDSLSREDRESTVLKQITSGNIPDFLRTVKPIDVEFADSQATKHTATYFVTPDYLAIGSNTDFFRIPMTPHTAQAIATAANTSLITTKISDDIFAHADLKLDPRPLTKDREAASTFFQHHQIIEEQRSGQPLGLITAGIKKDVVLTNRLKEKPHRVAIYGWHYPDGKPIQPLYVGHVDWYVDYSHGIRLMSQQILVDGRPMRVADVLKDNDLCGLLSSEGPIDIGYEP